MKTKQIITVTVDKLIAHPANPNKMAKAVFNKLVDHIDRTGNYEPIVIRKHPRRKEHFEILNGHHRLKAIMRLGYDKADCVVWDVSDDEADMLLLTLNRLQGRDDVFQKAELIKRLTVKFDSKELARQINQSRKSIEHLMSLTPNISEYKDTDTDFPIPLVFYLTNDQKAIVDSAVSTVTNQISEGTKAQKRSQAITNLCQRYLNRENGQNEKN